MTWSGAMPGGDEMGGRPAAPCADLDSAPPFECARVGVENRSFVAIDEADRRIASVDAKRMVDLLAKIRPSRGALVRLDHVRKKMIENRRFEIGGDVVVGHGSDLEQRNEMAAPAFNSDRFWALLLRRAIVRGEWHVAPAGVKNGGLFAACRCRNAAINRYLYLTCSRISCCLTGKARSMMSMVQAH